ncbi:MAG: hypothetical protein MN733_34640 [Nitrososphaera sp.]|nr:hypothetical protein [Nitrososphaera sp.]
MCVDYNTFLGPYVCCDNPPVQTQHEITTCTKRGCSRNGENISIQRYCSGCGTKIVVSHKTDTAPRVDTFEIKMLVDEELYDPVTNYGAYPFIDNVDVCISNRNDISGVENRSFDSRCDANIIDLTDLSLPQREIEAFYKYHSNALAILRNAYGYDNVRVRWGLLNYCS